MKAIRVVLAIAVLLATLALAAQEQVAVVKVRPLTDDDIALLRADIQADKTDVIGKTMKFSDDQGKVFWPLYREYANEQQKIGDQKVSLIKDYAASYDTIDDAKANDFAERYLKCEQDNLNLRKKYYPKFKKAVGAKQAAKFMQVDNRLNMLLNLQLASLIPIVR